MENDIQQAIDFFWNTRRVAGVRSGQTLDGFVYLIEKVMQHSSLPNLEIHTSKISTQLPGFFRPHKSWDVVVTTNGQLVAAIELKSQVGSIGKNYNNRSEEVLGSGIDLYEAINENGFSQEIDIFKGYIILVEDSIESNSTPTISMSFFPVMTGFLDDESRRGREYQPNGSGSYPRDIGVSYIQRYDELCKRLMFKKMYDAAAVIVSKDNGSWRSMSNKTDIRAFFDKLLTHCQEQTNYINGW